MPSIAWSQSTVQDRVILTTEGSATSFTLIQKEYLQTVLDDLCKINNRATAKHINDYVANGHATFGKEDPGTFASVVGGVLMNYLNINQDLGNWDASKEFADRYNQRGDYDKEEIKLHEARRTIRDLAFVLIHEDVHMNQTYPNHKPEYEDKAYEKQISEMRRVINEDMQKIREIQASGTKLPGDRDKLNELIEDLKVSKESYSGTVDSMQGDVIKDGIVTREKFKTSKADMDKLVEEASDLIKSVGIIKDPNDAKAWNESSQTPPSGYDQGVWVLTEKKSTVEKKGDTNCYTYALSVGGNTVTGLTSWDDSTCGGGDCRGYTSGTCTWTVPPSILTPGTKQETKETAQVDGGQSCSQRHISAYISMYINGGSRGPNAATGSWSSADPKLAAVSVIVPWEVPWGKMGDNMTIEFYPHTGTVERGGIVYTYTYQASAPEVKEPYSLGETWTASNSSGTTKSNPEGSYDDDSYLANDPAPVGSYRNPVPEATDEATRSVV